MKCFFILAGLCSVLFVSGCDETKSIQWWNDHHTEAIKRKLNARNRVVTAETAGTLERPISAGSSYMLKSLIGLLVLIK